MRTAIAIILLAGATHAQVSNPVAKYSSGTQDAMDKLVVKFVGKFFDRALKTLLNSTDVESTTVAKSHGRLSEPRGPPVNVQPEVAHAWSVRMQAPLHGSFGARFPGPKSNVGSGLRQRSSGGSSIVRASLDDESNRLKVKSVSPQEATKLMMEGWTLLDVRPPFEIARGAVKGAVAVPSFVEDQDKSAAGLLKAQIVFGTGGWWEGARPMKPNIHFMQQVLDKVDKNGRGVIVACQTGIRSLAAAEQMQKEGYHRLAWIPGGFKTVKPGEVPVEDKVDIRLAAVGGVAGLVGWTDVQQEIAKEKKTSGIAT